MQTKIRDILVTYALPYANGSLHLGHMVGLIQTDIWVRFLKMQGHRCFYICGCDSHGTPIMIQAEKTQTTPEILIQTIRTEHQHDLHDFLIHMENYHTTHSPENKTLVDAIFLSHQKKGNINRRTIKQAYDPEKNMFLPDRYIKGECPRCGAKDQYGDNCEVCGATYTTTELKNPYSTLSGAKPIEKESEHYFFKLQNYTEFLKKWTHAGHLQAEVSNKLDEWFKSGLEEWDISRDAPYFGFTIPGETQKYFYVWLDAPVGYLASFKNYCEKNPKVDFDFFWNKNSKAELYHFIGKDIIYFHSLFWPAILEGADFRTPTAIFTHGFLTIDGQKMSKSRGTFIKARTYLEQLSPEYLRYYIASKLSDKIEDIDINLDDFMLRVNADLVGKFVNIASRSASFLQKYFDNTLSKHLPEPELFKEFALAGKDIANKLEQREFSQAVRQIMTLADRANQYIDEKKPWSAIKDPSQQKNVHEICTMAINLFRLLMIYLKPLLPATAEKVEMFLNIAPLTWIDKDKPLLNHKINTFQPLAMRIDKKQIDALKSTTHETT
ncbi:methionine--tRNA ligase [Gammaproteobacteria bacterium SCGC AG-212-F23]|nr:methionine--tRNA ligase [Gammaproteobacteria bacterium SCGC AG-212-F23]